jgi:hypothetical protein
MPPNQHRPPVMPPVSGARPSSEQLGLMPAVTFLFSPESPDQRNIPAWVPVSEGEERCLSALAGGNGRPASGVTMTEAIGYGRNARNARTQLSSTFDARKGTYDTTTIRDSEVLRDIVVNYLFGLEVSLRRSRPETSEGSQQLRQSLIRYFEWDATEDQRQAIVRYACEANKLRHDYWKSVSERLGAPRLAKGILRSA